MSLFRRWVCVFAILLLASCGTKEVVPVVVPNPQEEELRELAEQLKKLDQAIAATDKEDLAKLPPAQGTSHPVGAPLPPNEQLPTSGTGQKLYFRERTILSDFGTAIGSMVPSPDGSTLAVTREKFIYLIDLPTGRVRMVISESIPTQFGSTRYLRALAWSTDGRFFATTGEQSVKLWNAADGKLIRAMPFLRGKAVTISPDGTAVAACDGDTLRIWDAQSGSIRGDSGKLGDGVGAEPQLMWSPNGEVIALGQDDGRIALFDPKTGRTNKVFQPESKGKEIITLSFTPDGSQLIAATGEKMLRIRDVATGEVRKTIDVNRTIESAVFSPGGKIIACCSLEEIQFLNAESGESIGTARPGVYLRGAKFSPDGNAMFIETDGRGVMVADLFAGCEQRVFPAKGNVLTVAPGFVLLGTRVPGEPPAIYDTVNGKTIPALADWPPVWSAPTFSPDGKMLAVLVNGNRISLREMPSGKEIGSFDIRIPVLRTAFAPDRPWLVLGGFGVMEVWDTAKKERIALLSHEGQIGCLRVVPGGKQLITGTQSGSLQWWDLGEQKLVREVLAHQGWITHIALSPDQKTLATIAAEDPVVRMWDRESGRELGAVRIPDNRLARFVAFTADGNFLMVLESDGQFRYWDTKTGEFAFIRPTERVAGIESADGSHVFGIDDGNVRVWKSEDLQRPPPSARKNLPPYSVPLPSVPGFIIRHSEETFAFRGVAKKLIWSGDASFAIAETDENYFALDMKQSKIIATGAFRERFSRRTGMSADAGVFAVMEKAGELEIREPRTGVVRHRVALTNIATNHALACSPDGKWVAILTSSDEKERIVIVDAVSGQRVPGLSWGDRNREMTIDAIYFSPDGTLIVQRDDAIECREPATWKLRFEVKLPERVYELTFSRDGQWFAASGMDSQGVAGHTPIHVWNGKGERVHTLFGHHFATEGMAFSPDGKSLATLLGNELRVWDLGTGKERRTVRVFGEGQATGMTFQGDRILIARNGQFTLWNYTDTLDDEVQKMLSAMDRVGNVTRDGDLYRVEMNYGGRGSRDAIANLRGFSKPLSLNIEYGAALSDEVLAPLGELPRLRELTIRNASHVGNSTLVNLGTANELQSLAFNVAGKVEVSGIEALSKLPKLRAMDLAGTVLTKDAWAKMKGCTHLESLRIGDDSDGVDMIAIIAEMPKLRELELVGPVSEIALKSIPKLKQLRKLKCPGTFDDASLPAIRDLIDLTDLSLTECAITDESLKQLVALKNLTRLDLSATMIKGPGLVHLKSLTKLTELVLQNMPNEVNSAVIDSLRELKSLKRLNLGETKLSPDAIETLKKALPNTVIIGN